MELVTMDAEQIRDMYEHCMREAFPPDELRPLAMILKAFREGRYLSYGVYEDGRLCTYATLMRLPAETGYDYLWDYFGTRKDLRNKGRGQAFIAALKEVLADRASLLFEIEDPDAAPTEEIRQLRERRRQYYLRNGFTDTGVRARLAGVDYRLFEYPVGAPHTPEEILALYERQYRAALPPALFDRFFGK